jgi:sortase A
MALYSYVKPIRKPFRRLAVLFSLTCLTGGFLLIAWVLYPIINFELFYAPRFSELVRPVPEKTVRQAIREDISGVLGLSNVDYTRASVWFPKATQVTPLGQPEKLYTLTIPKLRIENANVVIGTDDLANNLVHFTGPLPGSVGNPVIFGHSTIPWLYNPTDYKTIFSKLPDLKRGDNIIIVSDGVTYTYQVSEMKVVLPDDLSVLSQQYETPTISLVTCVPPGTYLKRLVVKGTLTTL